MPALFKIYETNCEQKNLFFLGIRYFVKKMVRLTKSYLYSSLFCSKTFIVLLIVSYCSSVIESSTTNEGAFLKILKTPASLRSITNPPIKALCGFNLPKE